MGERIETEHGKGTEEERKPDGDAIRSFSVCIIDDPLPS